MNGNISSILTILVSFDRSHWDLQNGTKNVKIDKGLEFVMDLKLLCNGDVIVRPAHYKNLIRIIAIDGVKV